jgi:hypothetical protein
VSKEVDLILNLRVERELKLRLSDLTAESLVLLILMYSKSIVRWVPVTTAWLVLRLQQQNR